MKLKSPNHHHTKYQSLEEQKWVFYLKPTSSYRQLVSILSSESKNEDFTSFDEMKLKKKNKKISESKGK